MLVEVLENVGRYEIVGDLGAGSMSRVYLAHDPNLDRKVALKVVLQSISLDNREQNELESRFLLEARAAGKLSHPGIVRVYDADTDPNLRIPYIAMEWVQGRSLRHLLDDGGRLSGPRTLEILEQVARALDYAHRAGRIHRDIKPSNILISKDGTAKVSDFGVAKIVSESHTISGQVLGTPAYMSPEQVKDDPLDGRSDLFSLGAVLYQCVSGVTPFSGDSLVQVVYKILNIDPRPLKLAATPALTQLAGVVERSLQKDPNSRFQTGSDFAEALEQIRLAMEADPGQDFRGTPPPPGFRPTPSDTIPTFVAPSQADPPSGSSTRTVQLSTASIHRATQGDPSPSGTHETVATGVRPGDRDSKMSRWRIAALLLLLLSVAGVSAVFRFERDNTSPTEVSTVTPSTEAATRERLIDSTEPPEPKLEAPVERAPEQTTAKAPSPQPQITTPRNENPTRQAAKQNPVVIEQVEDPSLQAEPVPQTLTPVTILYKHKGGPAFLSILLDGTRVWSQELKPVQGRMQKWTGYGNRAVIAVPPGTHTLQVNLSDRERDIDATNAIRSRYTNGKKRTLRVSLSPKENTLQLRWKE